MSLQVWGAIFVAWALGVLFAIALCRAAARADREAERMFYDQDEEDQWT